MTGKYPFRLGDAPWGTFPVDQEANSLGRQMQELGYATAVAGKWQLTLLGKETDHPYRLGFEQYSLFGWHEGPRYYKPLIFQNGKVRSDVVDRYGPDVYVDFLIDFMKANRDKPFFAYYPMALAHDVTDDLDEPPPLGPQGQYDSYKKMVENMDLRAGLLVDALGKLNLRQKTVVIFTGDNGTPKQYYFSAQGKEMLQQPIAFDWKGMGVKGGKGTLADSGTRVPLIVSWPGVLEASQVVDDLVDFSDFMPTILELAGGSVREDLNGVSFADRVRGRKTSPRKWAYSSNNGERWVRTQRWKLYDDGRMFDMSLGRDEQEPVTVSDASMEATQARKQLQDTLRSLTGNE